MRAIAAIVMGALALPHLGADPPDMLFRVEAQDLPTVASCSVTDDPHCVGGSAVILWSERALVGAAVELEAGDYTLLVSAVAPDAGHDAIYVTVPGGEVRRPIGQFGALVTLAQPFSVAEAGTIALCVRPDPNELGVAIDQVGLARGTVEAGVELADLDAPDEAVALAALAGVPAAGEVAEVTGPVSGEVTLAELPAQQHARGLDTLFLATFDASPDADYARGLGGCANLSGATLVPGKWGQALDCTAPATKLLYAMDRNLIARAGTLECWVRSAQANLWSDGAEHYLFTLRPRRRLTGEPRIAVRLEVFKGEDDALHVQAKGAPVPVDLAVPTGDLAPDAWHHVALSWDCTDAGTLALWLTIDGRGVRQTIPGAGGLLPFTSLQVGNTPWLGHYAHVGETAPLGGLIDDLHISDQTLARREEGAQPLDPQVARDLAEIDLDLALAAEDALVQWLDYWAGLQVGGAWGPWLSPRIAADIRTYLDWTGQPEDPHFVSNKYGSSIVTVAYEFIDAYRYTGDERWRQVAENSVDFFLRGQDPRGYWYQDYVVDESGRIEGLNTNWARIQDGHQSQPSLLMLYWHHVTGDRRAFEAARRNADFVLSIENPNGSWSGTYDTATDTGRTTGPRGVEYGCEYNDYATTDPMRMMMTMYLLTGDGKYLRGPEGSDGIVGIGQWMFDTQMGEGEVRGWCQQYDQDNNPVWSRAFEAPVIEPRVLNRFIHPQTVMLFLMTGNERYMRLLQESYDWYRAIEAPGDDGGWYYQYLPDGTPVYSDNFETIRIDPTDANAPRPSRDKLQLTAIQRDLEAYQQLGPEGFRESFRGSTELTGEDYLTARRAAVAWLRAREATVREEIERLERDGLFRSGPWVIGIRQVHLYNWVMQMRIARGVAPDAVVPRGGRSPWQIGGGGWKRPVAHIDDWFDIPLEDPAQ